ncbi:MAG: DUF3383 family protein [Candidatus Marinimicrobia bacterium]|nr:DUF3383 family protein [Candidatus Neomarinimicrobiota bacterium]
MLKNGTGVQSNYDANLPFTMVGVPNAPYIPTAIKSMQIDPSQGGVKFIPGETWVSRTDKGTIIKGIAPNSNLFGITLRGASQESLGDGDPVFFAYEQKGPVPVGTTVTVWINVVTAPTRVETEGIAINNETGKATAYDNSATAGFFTGGVSGALSVLQAITDGSLTVGVDGAAAANVPNIDFSAAADMDGIASILEAALTGVFVNYNSAENLFVFTSAAESAISAVLITAGTTGTDLHLEANLNTAGGSATAGTAAGSPPSGYTAEPRISINKWAASNPLKVEVSFQK